MAQSGKSFYLYTEVVCVCFLIQSGDSGKTYEKIDDIVYERYGITEEERKIIEGR